MNTSSKGSPRLQFVILIATIVAAGLSQGLLLPLLTVILEEMGVPSHLNGLNAGMLYIGTFAMMLFVEPLLGRLGYKKLLSSGLIVVLIALVLFPLFPNLWVWFLAPICRRYGRQRASLRDPALGHYVEPRGSTRPQHFFVRHVVRAWFQSRAAGHDFETVRGMAAVRGHCNLFPDRLMARPNVSAESPGGETGYGRDSGTSLRQGVSLGLVRSHAGVSVRLYGSFHEHQLSLYALKIGIDAHWISFMLPFFGIGGLLLQLPLGILSDRYERKNVLMGAGFIGGIAFLALPAAGASVWGIALLFAVAGGMLGSFYSLGLAYAADILPKELLPTANVIATYLFSIASIVGPNLGGLGIQYWSAQSMFWVLGGLFLLFTLLGFAYRQKQAAQR